MIVRIVKMEFKAEKVADFVEMFDHVKSKIKGQEGCLHLELMRGINEDHIFFTYSHWESEDHLNAYRHSELFEETWAYTKTLFSGRPQAWSVDKVVTA